MRVAIATDHAGLDLKQPLVHCLESWGQDILDLGTRNREPLDYPD
jgi:ribose 5-phosphate isomerase B